MDFIQALKVVDRAWQAWAEKDHNHRWVRHIDHTPISNDLRVTMARMLVEEMNKTDMQKMIHEFHLKAQQATPERVLPPEEIPWELRWKLIMEEATEFKEAAEKQDIVEAVDAICDLLYVVIGSGIAIGIPVMPFFLLVHESNMAKFGPGGYRREDGKWMKPPDWQKPDIAGLLENYKP